VDRHVEQRLSSYASYLYMIRLRPGARFLVVTGGLGDGSVSIDQVSKKKFEKQYTVTMYKPPLLNNSTTEYCLPDSMKDADADLENEEIAKIEG
jgi:hypothetical protein